MKKTTLSILISSLIFIQAAYGQDTLPKFSLLNAGNNRVIIGWSNTFTDIRQISIQRSSDSLAGYKTILTVPDPDIPQNGYVDTRAPNDRMFYRLYIMRDKGVFLFSDAKRPMKDTTRVRLPASDVTVTYPSSPAVVNPDTIRIGDSFIVAKPFGGVKLDKFPKTDSVATPVVNNNKRPTFNAFTPSLYVYTFKDGYVRVSLPDAEKIKKYSIKFFEDNGNFLFELKDMREKEFKLDKTNFYHAGWFRFELYEDEKLLEKHKFLIEKEF